MMISKECVEVSKKQRARLKELRRQAMRIVQGEFIGREVLVQPHSGGDGIKGMIIDETRDTLVLERTKKRRVRVIKAQHTFEFLDGRKRIRVHGSLITRRPEDRLKIKIRW